MNPLLKKILIVVGLILAVLAIGALVLKGICYKKCCKQKDRQSECSHCCKTCSSDDDDDDDDECSDDKMKKKKKKEKKD